jgi:hypothetical protein
MKAELGIDILPPESPSPAARESLAPQRVAQSCGKPIRQKEGSPLQREVTL